MNIDLTGKTVLITGGSSGIGEGCVKIFSLAGASVFFTYNKNAERSATLARETSSIAIKCEVSSEEACKQAVSEVVSKSGKLDVLVNNAGIFMDAAAGSNSYLDAWKRTIDVNLSSSAYFIHYAVPYMKKGGAKIVNISSIHSVEGTMDASAYHASKAGMDGLTRSMAVELAPHNIQVNSIGPGAIMTPMWDDPEGDFVKPRFGS